MKQGNFTHYSLPNDITKDIRMIARFELHSEEYPDCKVNSVAGKAYIRSATAERVLSILIQEEKKKLLK